MFSGLQTFIYVSSAVLICGRFADIQEMRFKTEKLLDMGCAVMQVILFADCQEWYFQAAKR